jgi:hypothetical protein
MTLADALYELRGWSVEVRVDGSELVLDGPEAFLDRAVELVKPLKQALIDYLRGSGRVPGEHQGEVWTEAGYEWVSQAIDLARALDLRAQAPPETPAPSTPAIYGWTHRGRLVELKAHKASDIDPVVLVTGIGWKDWQPAPQATARDHSGDDSRPPDRVVRQNHDRDLREGRNQRKPHSSQHHRRNLERPEAYENTLPNLTSLSR